MKHAIILGTRPEIIKLSSLVRLMQEKKSDYFIIHSNQHYSKDMDEIFFEELELPKPKYNLGVGSNTHAKMTAKILEGLEDILIREKPDVIYVQGDTNTVMAGALTASKLGVKIAHIEAGLRSYDRDMPEEVNRIVTDHISDYLFPPTAKSAQILETEGIDKAKIHTVGNTIVDAVYQNLEISKNKINTLDKLGLKENNYFLLTMHRPSNVDNKEILSGLLATMGELAEKHKVEVVFPIHPRTSKQIESFNIELDSGIRMIEPVGFLDMLQLESGAKVILTDSGGIQEEACILHTPCVTLRENTERPEVVEVGASILAGRDHDLIMKSVSGMLNKDTNWQNPLGDGNSAKNIYNVVSGR